MQNIALQYESSQEHPGRFRVHTLHDSGIEIELIPRSARNKIPVIVLIWVLTVIAVSLIWWGAYSGALGEDISRAKAVFVAAMMPFGALGLSAVALATDRQRLTIRVDQAGVTIVQFMLGGPDRQHLAMGSILGVGVHPGDAQMLKIITSVGGADVRVMRDPKYVAEMAEMIAQTVGRLQVQSEHTQPVNAPV